MAPKLSLDYVSGGGDGIAGWGWSVSGASSTISRCGQTTQADGKKGGVSYSDSDRYCLNGSELVAVAPVAGGSPGTYGADKTEYRTPIESFARVVSNGGSASSGPDSFTVYAKSGRVQTYTAQTMKRSVKSVKLTALNSSNGTSESPEERTSSSSDVKAVWLLTSEKDHAGNEIRYSYDRAAGTRGEGFTVKQIDYTYGAGAKSASRSVRFDYESRSDKGFSFVNGVGFESTKRLKTIRMFAPNPQTTEEVWRYNLSYRTSGAGGSARSELSSVQKCGVAGGTQGGCLASKNFTWSDSSLATGSVPDFTTTDVGSAAPLAGDDHSSVVLDVNGDGLTDQLSNQGSVVGKSKLVLQLGTRDSSGNAKPFGKSYDVASGAFSAFPESTLKAASLSYARPVDIDGDGKDELLAVYAQPSSGWFIKSSEAFSYLMRWDASSEKWVNISNKLAANADHVNTLVDFGDVDGDGLPEAFSDWGGKWQVQKNLRSTFGVMHDTGISSSSDNIPPSLYAPRGSSNLPVFSATTGQGIEDVNGDGRADLMTKNRLSKCGASPCADWETWTTVNTINDQLDASGSSRYGIKENVLTGGGAEYVYSVAPFGDMPFSEKVNTGSSWVEHQNNLGRWSFKRGDFNGDGLEDQLAVPIRGNTKGLILWNTGNGLSWDGTTVTIPHDDLASVEIGDLNHDGRDDVVSFYNDGLSIDHAASGADTIVIDSSKDHQRIAVEISTGQGDFVERKLDVASGDANILSGRAFSKLGDFNGDGLLDITEIDAAGYPGGAHQRIYQQKASEPDVITSVRDEDASGASVAAEYSQQWSDDMAGQANRSCSFAVLICTSTGQRVVRKLTTQDTYDSDAKPLPVYYSYEDPQVHPTQGSMGFGKVIAWDPNRPSETVTTYKRDSHGVYWMPQIASTVQRVPVLTQAQVAAKPATAKVRQTSTTYADGEDRSLNGGATLAVLPKGSTVTVSEGTMNLDWSGTPAKSRHITAGSADPAVLRTVSETLDHDDYGNETSKSTTVAGGSKTQVTTVFGDVRKDDWLISLPTQVKTTSTPKDGSAVTRTVDSHYNTAGLPDKVETEKASTDESVKSSVATAYDALGVVTSVTTSAKGVPTRVTHSEYAPLVSGQPDEEIYPSQTWSEHDNSATRPSS
ncbi:FG-GAP repeat domain-containing protein, partial [Streptomyces sp. NPDC086783]|uniref:FG-GAP repeat domain-containing protein n=1 Tax=Streptomyces sp. NPDC086783 TaxID=3365758 RepID=UPI003821AE75